LLVAVVEKMIKEVAAEQVDYSKAMLVLPAVLLILSQLVLEVPQLVDRELRQLLVVILFFQQLQQPEAGGAEIAYQLHQQLVVLAVAVAVIMLWVSKLALVVLQDKAIVAESAFQVEVIITDLQVAEAGPELLVQMQLPLHQEMVVQELHPILLELELFMPVVVAVEWGKMAEV
jgi:hypothetical protein